MLTPTETRRYAAQSRRLHNIQERIRALEAVAPFSNMPQHEQNQAQQVLDGLRLERDEILERLPAGDVTAFFGDPISLTYDR